MIHEDYKLSGPVRPEPVNGADLRSIAGVGLASGLRPHIVRAILFARGLLGQPCAIGPGIAWDRIDGQLFLDPGAFIAIADAARRRLETGGLPAFGGKSE